jgi:hypothetical protein
MFQHFEGVVLPQISKNNNSCCFHASGSIVRCLFINGLNKAGDFSPVNSSLWCILDGGRRYLGHSLDGVYTV